MVELGGIGFHLEDKDFSTHPCTQLVLPIPSNAIRADQRGQLPLSPKCQEGPALALDGPTEISTLGTFQFLVVAACCKTSQ